jgi:hypothetical protein
MKIFRNYKLNPYIQDLLAKLTGCQDLSLVDSFSKLSEIDSSKKAKKLEIISSWKFILGKKQ